MIQIGGLEAEAKKKKMIQIELLKTKMWSLKIYKTWFNISSMRYLTEIK